MPLPFKLKRLKNGMPFLKNTNYAIPSIFISLVIISIFFIVNNNKFTIIYPIIALIIIFLAPLIYLYWKTYLTKTYLDKLNERNLTDLNQTISQQAEYITKLEDENAQLAKIIHKDNKLIPTLELAVHKFLNGYVNSEKDVLTTGKELLIQLNSLSTERKEILQYQDMQCQQLISTKVFSIDSLLDYMQHKAAIENITFQTNISCDMLYFIEQIMNENDLNTLLADLLENAIIATRHNKGHYILLSIGIISNTYSISVFDSGIPFSKDVLVKWGLEQITTHKIDGGSGIGMITTYEILNKYHASFIIHELGTNSQTFTKEVTISFNKMHQYILQTHRTEEELSFLSKRLDLQIIRH